MKTFVVQELGMSPTEVLAALMKGLVEMKSPRWDFEAKVVTVLMVSDEMSEIIETAAKLQGVTLDPIPSL